MESNADVASAQDDFRAEESGLGRLGCVIHGAMKRQTADIRVGISGWNYPPWRGVFYPKKWPQRRELEFASRQVNSIEINGTFYSLQRPESFRRWHAETPEDFVFAIKGGRFITHMKKLKEVETPLA